MPKKYRFRKMFFVCEDKKVISPDTHMTSAYQFKSTADQVCSDRTKRTTHFEWEDKTKPVRVSTVEGFYLVHESFYDEVLKKYVEGD
ncbi:hypothetical protein [Desertivirga xinjiangensis]|uniref:hypothetical protein n=1 Tax=Desertivirga xinjiangensis TaxID=539206 RepID=UPI0021088BEC|nr:hypothetical protein [Pedobacter xinjiangensis]